VKIKRELKRLGSIAPRSRIIPKAFGIEVTVVQEVIKAERQERAVFVPALTFLVTFCVKTKSNSRY